MIVALMFCALLMMVMPVFGQSIFSGHSMVVKSGHDISTWSATRGDTLVVVGGAADSSAVNGQFDTEYLLINGACFVTEVDSIPDSTMATLFYVLTRYRCAENEGWTGWVRADSVAPSSYDQTTLVSRKRTVWTWPTNCKPTQIQTKYLATGTGSRVGKARSRLETW